MLVVSLIDPEVNEHLQDARLVQFQMEKTDAVEVSQLETEVDWVKPRLVQ